MMIVKTIALVGGYKYKPGTCVILAVTNKRTVKRRLKLNAKNIERAPINIFSINMSRFNCF